MRVRIWLSLAILLFAGPATAAAHSALQGLAPSQGDGFRLSFSAPVESAFLRTMHRDGRNLAASIDPGDDQTVLISLASLDSLDVRWRVLSRDGHVTEGRLDSATAAVIESPRRSPASVVADMLAFATLVGLVGLLAVRFVVVAPAWRTGGTRPPGSSWTEHWQRTVDRSLRRGLTAWWRTWWSLVAAAAASLVLGPIGLLAELDSSDLGALVGTRWGIAWLVQAAGLAIAAAAALALGRSSHRAEPDPPRGWGYAAGIALGVAAAAIAWSGHASSGTDAAIGIGIDAVHLWATGIWLGGLAALLAIVPHARRGLDDADATRFSAAVVVRFSAVAIVCVGTLVVTGVYRAIAELTALDDLIDTGYGQALLVKLIIFAALLIGGVYNRLVLHPRLERAALGLRSTDAGAGHALRISVAAEIAMAVVLLVVVGVLVNLPPP